MSDGSKTDWWTILEGDTFTFDRPQMITGIERDMEELTQCPHCYCMTKTIDNKCGKCGGMK